MKQATQMRTEVLAAIGTALERLRIRVSMYMGDDVDILKKLERPAQFDLTAEVTNMIMTHLGHEKNAPSEVRFDKSRRSLGQERRYAKAKQAYEQEQERAKSQEATRIDPKAKPSPA